MSTVLEYRPSLDACKSKYIKARRHFISNQTVEQIFTNVTTKKNLDCDLHGLQQRDKYYSIADLKYDLKRGAFLPRADVVLPDTEVGNTTDGQAEITEVDTTKVQINTDVSSRVDTLENFLIQNDQICAVADLLCSK